MFSEAQAKIDGKPAWDGMEAELDALTDLGVRIMTRTTAIGYYHQNMIGLCQKLTDHLENPAASTPRERMWRVRPQPVILAQGALAKPPVFYCNDPPGAMLARSAPTDPHPYGVRGANTPAILSSPDTAHCAPL